MKIIECLFGSILKGNLRGIKQGDFRVIAIDAFSNECFIVRDCSSLALGNKMANERGGASVLENEPYNPLSTNFYVFNDRGEHVGGDGLV